MGGTALHGARLRARIFRQQALGRQPGLRLHRRTQTQVLAGAGQIHYLWTRRGSYECQLRGVRRKTYTSQDVDFIADVHHSQKHLVHFSGIDVRGCGNVAIYPFAA